MQKIPDISIITSAYNSTPYLKRYFEALCKVINDLTKNSLTIEVLLIFNEVTEPEREKLDNFLYLVSEDKNVLIKTFYVKLENLYHSWNRGINASSGNCISFWNVDDIRYADALSAGLQLIESGAKLVYFPHLHVHRRGVVVSIGKLIYKIAHIFGISMQQPDNFILNSPLFTFPKTERKVIKPPTFNRDEFMRSFHCGPFFMFHRSLFKKVGPFDEQFKIAGDFEWCVRAAKLTEFTRSKKIAGEMIIDGTNLSGRGDPIHVAENNVVYLRHGAYDKLQTVDETMMQKYSIHDMEFSNNVKDSYA